MNTNKVTIKNFVMDNQLHMITLDTYYKARLEHAHIQIEFYKLCGDKVIRTEIRRCRLMHAAANAR